MIKTVSHAIDDMAVSLGASPSAEIPTVAQALENVYTRLGGTRTDLDTLVVSEVIDLVAPLIQGGGGGGEISYIDATFTVSSGGNATMPSYRDNNGIIGALHMFTIRLAQTRTLTFIANYDGKAILSNNMLGEKDVYVDETSTGIEEITDEESDYYGDWLVEDGANIVVYVDA